MSAAAPKAVAKAPAKPAKAAPEAPKTESQREAGRNAEKRAGRQSSASGSFFLVRIRGTVHVTGKIRDTLKMLNLNRPNHAVVVPRTESYVGMVNRVKDYVAYGDIDAATMTELIAKRGRAMGDKPIDNEFVKTATGNKFGTVEAFAKAVTEGKASMKDLGEDAKPVFRLTPPAGGHKGSTKRHYTVKGELGYRGKDINALVKRMI
jgi:large subunit ribosomal protein L30